MLKQKKEQKVHNGIKTAGKNGLYEKDLLLMAWKMLDRRGSLQPFRGHREKR